MLDPIQGNCEEFVWPAVIVFEVFHCNLNTTRMFGLTLEGPMNHLSQHKLTYSAINLL